MDEIAAEAEVARGTLFNYFPTKGDLVGALMVDRTKGLTNLIYREAESDRPFPERIGRVFALSAQALEEALPLSRGLIDPAQQGWSNAVGGWDVVKTLLDAFAHLLTTAPDAQLFRSDVSVEQLAEILLGLYSGAVNVWRVNERYPLSSRLEHIAKIASEIVKGE
jgi:AcrR family transcriptional regulator